MSRITIDGGQFRLARLLKTHARIAVCGPPRAGKSSLAALAAELDDRPILHTDDAAGVEWGDQPELWLRKTAELERFLLEGVQVSRCLRRGLDVDLVIRMPAPLVALTPGQDRLAKGEQTVWLDALARRPARRFVVW